MAYTTFDLTVADGIARITLTRTAQGNPIDGTFCRDLYEAAVELSGRNDVRAILLTAQGRAFSYGGDLASFLSRKDELPYLMRLWTGDFHTAIARLQRLDAPIVAAVHGVCAGGMAAVVAGADFVLGCPDTKFVAAYCGIGLACDGGASVSLQRRMGWAKAGHYLMLNQALDANASRDAGLLDQIHPSEDLMARAEDLVHQLAAGPTRSFGEVRQLLRSANELPLEAQLEAEAQAMARASATADAREAIVAFSEKRKPVFNGV